MIDLKTNKVLATISDTLGAEGVEYVPEKVHSLAIDPETHRVYAPEQEADGKAVARMAVYEAVVP